ncbi:AsnC family transcriptional regulator [Desulfatitalea alkaliphila]|uniref:siroheme decarboxylase n=1 Tax=Desulfatitalea alkaliphila TaxID=2929485 RepID=A0AA41R618_9BACT|nr:AsnC family transcriptional regulator [Desulfatitalea alkaliphila]MCJ8503019.1 AsnC family transcriptional regulator [Desulfatitalea alkaliphila]
MPLDDTDKAILNRIQSDFPIAPRPYQVIAQELNLTEDQVIARVQALKANGIIRRIGGNFVPDKVGFVSTLCAAQVPEDQVDHFAQVVNRYPGVTHNYQRDNRFNVWFTFIARSREEITHNLNQIKAETKIQTILNLPATKLFKIRAQFDL